MIDIDRIYGAYEDTANGDRFRILVDRLRPRGISREKARVDLWLKEIDPINDLREWFGHDPRRRSEFKKRYFMELNNKKDSQSRSLSEGKRRRCSATLRCQR